MSIRPWKRRIQEALELICRSVRELGGGATDSQTVTVVISVAALALSLVATFVTWGYQRGETERTLRQELSGVMKKLVDIDTKQLDLMGKSVQESSPIIGEFNQQRGLLAGQAAFLLRQIKPSKVASVEYNQLALLYVRLGNIPQARKYFEHSVKRARKDDSLTRADAVRAFASFQFAQHELEAGRKSFEEASRLVDGKHDYELSATVNILQSWAVSEAFIGDMVRAHDRLEKARQVDQSIQNPAMRFPLISTLPSPGTPQDQIGSSAPHVPSAGPVAAPGPPTG